MDFYVYKHIRLDSKTPFYIGKGSKDRAWSSKNRNKYWKNIVKSVGYEVEVILKTLTEKQAFEKEIELIQLHKKLGQCEANLTHGGEGLYGKKHTKETKIKMRNAKLGISRPEDFRKTMSTVTSGKSNPRWLGYVICPLGIFETTQEAKRLLNLSDVTILKRCRSKAYPAWKLRKRRPKNG